MGLVIILIVAALVVYCLLEYNNLTMLSESTKEKLENMDGKMKKRWEIVPKFLNLVRIYLNDEKVLIREIDHIISNSYNSLIPSRKREADLSLTEKISELINKAENNQELAMNPKHMILLSDLRNLESELAEIRKEYNEDAKILNKKVKGFPSNIVAKIFGFKEQVIFE